MFELVAHIVGAIRQIRGAGRIMIGHHGNLIRPDVPSPHALPGKVASAEKRIDVILEEIPIEPCFVENDSKMKTKITLFPNGFRWR